MNTQHSRSKTEQFPCAVGRINVYPWACQNDPDSCECVEPVIIHLCPPGDSGIMPCCGRTPFEVMSDRMTLDPVLVTCLKGKKAR